jgi:hypothetical protein
MGAGAIGQLCVVMPEREAVLAMTAAAPDMQATLNVVWDTLLPGMDATGNMATGRQSRPRRALRGLWLKPPPFRDDPIAAHAIDGATFDLRGGGRLRSISFSFVRGRLVVRARGRRSNTFRCGAGRWAAGRARREGSRDRLSQPVRCAYRWTEDGALEVTVRWIAGPFCDSYTCRFDGKEVEVRLAANVALVPTDTPPVRGSRR